jgi:L,D-transpeptidase YcbB
VKKSCRKKWWGFTLSMLWATLLFAQITPVQLQQYITENENISRAGIKYADAVKEYYRLINFSPTWINQSAKSNTNILLSHLQLSTGLGLNEKDYQYNFTDAYRKGTVIFKNTVDSVEAELKLTDAAIHFFSEIVYGNSKPAFGYDGLKYKPVCSNIPALLAEHIAQNKLSLLIASLTPPLPEITLLKNKLQKLLAVMGYPGFKETIITSTKLNSGNRPLITKLYQFGIIDSPFIKMPDSIIKEKLKEAQRQFNIQPDGALRSKTLHELNTPLRVRLQQLTLSINYYRWLHCLTQTGQVIVVNIPAAYLKVYCNDKVMLEMRMIVGKKSTPTYTLTSRVDEVILYPYWHVPYSIATKELLPQIKRDPGYIDENNYQVLNSEGKIINPYAVNWHAFSINYFPYLIRQSTGCDNALGLLKLNFYNPFGAYLHDTPTKPLFKLNNRFYSHGCMRMEQPMQLGHLVLKNNPVAIDTLEQKGCIRNQNPIIVPADVHMPVIIWYNPAGIDSTGRVLFFEDIYEKFDWMKK